MKNLIKSVAVLSFIFATSAFAKSPSTPQKPPILETLVECTTQLSHPDIGTGVSILENPQNGELSLEVNRFSLGHNKIDEYLVKEVPQNPKIKGAPLVYKGKKASLTLIVDAAPNPKGISSVLNIKNQGSMDLYCKIVK